MEQTFLKAETFYEGAKLASSSDSVTYAASNQWKYVLPYFAPNKRKFSLELTYFVQSKNPLCLDIEPPLPLTEKTGKNVRNEICRWDEK